MKKFLRRHEHLLMLVGTLIVFLTFVTKETLREHWKDLATSIEHTEDVFLDRQDTELIVGQISQLKRALQINFEQPRAVKNGGSADSEGDARRGQNAMVDSIWSSLTTLQNLDGIVEKLPNPADHEESRRQLIQLARTTHNQCIFDLDKDETFAPGALERCVQQVSDIRARLRGLVESVLNDARPVQDRYSRISETFGRISILLYFVGWGMGFVSKIYGIKGSGGGE